MKHSDKARELFMEGYNCAQAVACAFADDMGMDIDTVARMASPFGGGLGRLREVCGCVSGMALVSGILYGYSDPEAAEEKSDLYAFIQELAGEFNEKMGSIVCRDLLKGITDSTEPAPEARTESYYHNRPCAELAAVAAGILEERMKGKSKK